jgi:hypothetical protein
MAASPRRVSRPPSAFPPSSRPLGPLVLAVASALLAGASFGVLVLDFGAHVDGVGIGLEWSRPLGPEYGWRAGAVLAASLVQGGLSLWAFGRTPAKSFGVLGLFGVAFVGLFGGFLGAGHALPAWWKLGCNRGHAYACYAAAGVVDGDAGRALDERACAGDVGSACLRIARADPTKVPGICDERRRACAGPSVERPSRSRCLTLADLCANIDPPSP